MPRSFDTPCHLRPTARRAFHARRRAIVFIAAAHFAAAALCVAAAGAADPKEKAARQAIYKCGGSVFYEPGGTYVLCQRIDNETIPSLQFIPHLRRLHIMGLKLTDDGLARLPALKDLEELEFLDAQMITNRGVAHLKRLTNLRSLSLSRCWVTGRGLGFLGELPRLRSLWLSVAITADKPDEIIGFQLGPDGRTPCPVWSYTQTTAGLEQIAKLTKLEELGLGEAPVDDADLKYFASLRNLRVLSVRAADVRGPGLEYLKGMTHLKTINLKRTLIRGDALRYLSGFTDLEDLNLGHGPVTQVAGKEHPLIQDKDLAHLKNLTRLQTLDLSGSPITDAGLVHLAGLRQLTSLDLSATQISDTGLDHLKGLRHLTALRVCETAVTAAGVKRIFADFRGIEIAYGRWETLSFGERKEGSKQIP